LKLASKGQKQFWEEQSFRVFRLRKRIYQWFVFQPGESKTVLLITGCQRSGTSMIHHLFRKDITTITYDEYSQLSVLQGEEPLQWRSVNNVVDIITADRSPLVVTKPLVETQNLSQWLDAFPEAKGIWMFREVHDVVSSSLKYFGVGVGCKDIVPIVAGDESNWRRINLSSSVVSLIREIQAEGITPSDCAALFWYARNSLLFSQELDKDKRVAICQYEDLVTMPVKVMTAAYVHLGISFPGPQIVSDVTVGSIGKGSDVMLSPSVDQVCREMSEKLRALERLG